MAKKTVLEQRPGLKEEWQKLKQLSGSERIWYIWQYYKFHLAVLLAAVFLVCMLLPVIRNLGKETVLSGVILNVHHDPVGESYLQDTYLAYIGASEKEAIVSLRTDMSLDVSGESSDLQSGYNMQALAALLSTGTEDFLLCSKETIPYIQQMSGGIFADLSQVLPQTLYDSLQEAGLLLETNVITYSETEGPRLTQDLFPAAIDVSHTHFKEGFGIADDTEVYLCFLKNSPAPEHFITMTSYLFPQFTE